MTVVETTAERPSLGGEVVGRAPDGRIVFLRGAAPGDRVRARVLHEKKRWLRAEVVDVLEPGAGRVPPACPHVERCGGCPWQVVDRGAQREALRAHIERVVGAPVPPLAPLAGLGWRSTARVHWADGAVGYRGRGTDEVVDIDACPVLAPEVAAVFAALRDARPEGEGTARLTAAPGASSGTIASASGAPRRALSAPAVHGALLSDVAYGEPFNRFEGVLHPADAFVQAHRAGNALLRATVVELAGGAASVLELYAGSGNLTFALAGAGSQVTAVESLPSATEALAREAEVRGLPVTAVTADAARPPDGSFDLVVLDPPRSGARAAVRALHERGARRLVYVSCDPATLGRDLDWLKARGWAVDYARGFDLFPHTGHVETLVRVTR